MSNTHRYTTEAGNFHFDNANIYMEFVGDWFYIRNIQRGARLEGGVITSGNMKPRTLAKAIKAFQEMPDCIDFSLAWDIAMTFTRLTFRSN